MLITSGFSFDGYTITKYSGYISGDDAISVDRGLAVFGSDTGVKDKLLNSLVEIRRNALRELKEAAYELGCNAVIGVDFDYITLDPQTKDLLATGGEYRTSHTFCGHRQRQRGRNSKKNGEDGSSEEGSECQRERPLLTGFFSRHTSPTPSMPLNTQGTIPASR